MRKQLPITVAESITIHKSQGATFQSVAIDLSDGRKLSRSALYVACSRATSAAGLFLTGKFYEPCTNKTDLIVLNELDRLAKHSEALNGDLNLFK